jgi:hypothetical protein
MRGHYKIYLDGKLVSEQDNIITNFGKNLILKYLASNVSSYAGAVAVGVSPKNPSPSDYVLDYELFRIPIAYKTVNPANSSIIFKGTAGSKYIGKIYEIGLFPSLDNPASGAFQTSTLFGFDSDENWQNVVLRDITNARIGSSGIQMNALTNSNISVYNSLTAINLAGYSPTDVFKLAFVTFDTNCSYVTVKFTNAAGAEITGNFIPAAHTAGAGNPQYQIVSLTKNTFSNQNADWSSIVSSTVTLYAGAGGASQVTIDGLKVVDADNLNPEYGLVSRALLGTPVVKTGVQTIDVEYSLEVPL